MTFFPSRSYWLCLLAVSSVAENDTNETVNTVNASENVSTTSHITSACHIKCDGLSELQVDLYDLRLRQASGEEVSLLEQCMTVQKHADVVKCIMHGDGLSEASCVQANEELEVLRANCVLVGRDILAPLVESTYTPTRCTHCMPASGALLREVLRIGLLECEDLCEMDLGCRGFDYDTIRGLCRTWGICPTFARSDQNGCQWTVYDQPGQSTRPTTSRPEVNMSSSTSREPNRAVAVSDAVAPSLRGVIVSVAFVLSISSAHV